MSANVEILNQNVFEEFVEILDPDIGDNIHVILGNLDKGITDKHVEKFVKRIVKLIRDSVEYKIWVWRMKFGVHNCSICDWDEKDGAKLEVHHTPATLYEIVEDRILQLVREAREAEENGEKTPRVTVVDIVKYIAELHLKGNVEGIVVCDCCHRKLHKES